MVLFYLDKLYHSCFSALFLFSNDQNRLLLEAHVVGIHVQKSASTLISLKKNMAPFKSVGWLNPSPFHLNSGVAIASPVMCHDI